VTESTTDRWIQAWSESWSDSWSKMRSQSRIQSWIRLWNRSWSESGNESWIGSWTDLRNHDAHHDSISIRVSEQRSALGSGLSAVRGAGYRLVGDADAGADACNCARVGGWSVRPGKSRSDSDCDERRCWHCDDDCENRCVRCYVERRVRQRICEEDGGGRMEEERSGMRKRPTEVAGRVMTSKKGGVTQLCSRAGKDIHRLPGAASEAATRPDVTADERRWAQIRF
jgi:hypothetical protein